MNKHSSPGSHRFVELSNLLHHASRSLIVVFALGLLPFASISSTRVFAQTPDARDAAAEKAFEEGLALTQQGTAESLRAAIAKLETARNIFHETRNQLSEANSLLWLGSINNRLGENQQALAYYNQALPLYRSIGDRDGEATTLNNIGAVYSDLGERKKALEYHKQALTLNQSVGDKYEEAVALNNIGLVYADLGEKQTALGYHNQALLLFRAVGDKRGEALVLSNIGSVYVDLGERQKALEYFIQSLPLRKAVGDIKGEAVTLNNIGGVYSLIGEQQKALEYFNQALPLYRAVGKRDGEAVTLNNIGSVYSDLGEKQKALEYYRQSLPLRKAVGDKNGEAKTLSNIGSIYADLGEKQAALGYHNQALILYDAVGDRNGEASVLSHIGSVYSSLGEKQKAVGYHNQALTLARSVGDRDGEATALNNIGLVYADLGEKQTAVGYYNQALLLLRAVGNKRGEAITLSNLRLVWQALNNPRLAVFFGKQSVNRHQELRRAIQGLDKEIQKTYLQTVAVRYRSLADLLIEQGRLPEAQFVLGLLKEEEFFEFVRRDKEEIAALAKSVEFNEVEREAFAEYARLADELTAIGAKYQTLFDKRSTLGGQPLPDAAEEADFQRLSRQLATTSETFKRFLDRLAGEFARAKPGNNVQIARINDLQADLREVGPDVVLVSTFVLPDRYRVILTTGQTQVDRKTEIKEADLNRKLTCFLIALKNPRVDPRPLGKELYDILVKPLEHDLEKGKFKTILWSLDGALRYIPVAALWDGEHYLAERYENAIITLGRNSRLFREINRNWRALGAGVSAKWPGFDALPAVKTELRSIVRDERLTTETEGVLPGRRLLDGEFLSSRLKDLLPSSEGGRRFNLVHLASHFKLRQTRDSSFLLLGDGTELSLTEFDKDPQLKLTGVELLTLSACETGVGIDKGHGSEFESLGMLAEKNGAKAVMATLWQVGDCSTGEFMREFYRLYQKAEPQGMTKAAALQQAQQRMFSGAIQAPSECQAQKETAGTKPDVCATPPFSPNPAKPFAHPYYWAPFVLFGNWR